MLSYRTATLFALVIALLALPACGREEADAGRAVEEERSAIRETIRDAMVEARQEIEKGNISIGNHKAAGLPKAEITPAGELLIGGKPVAVDEAQRALLLEYRRHVAAVAGQGMEIGAQGAEIAATAVGEAFKGLFSGKSGKDIEKTVEAEAARIREAALELCRHLPAMLESQQKLAAALPEFRPYATMTQEDVDDCARDAARRDTARAAGANDAIRQEIRDGIRDGIREGVRGAAQSEAAADADAAAEPAAAPAR